MSESVISRIEYAATLAAEAGALAARHFGEVSALTVEHKGPQDVVSVADREVEHLIRSSLARQFPADGFVGEETGVATAAGDAPIWVVDPIDGTQCFLAGIPSWCVSIGLVRNGAIVGGVIHDPNARESFVGVVGEGATCNGRAISPSESADFTAGLTEVGWSPRVAVDPTVRFIEALLQRGGIYRRSGSGALGLAYVACGRYLGYFEGHMNCWDSCAGAALVTAAGGWVNDVLDNNGLEQGSVVAAASRSLAPHLAALAREVGHPV